MGRVPGEHVARNRRALHQQLRELRATATRRGVRELELTATRAEVLRRKAAAGAGAEADAQRRALEGLGLALAAHDPRRVLDRGYAIVDDREGGLVTSAEQARALRALRVTFSDASVDARIEE